MNKLIAPIILILAFTVTSCSDDAKKAINNIASQSEETLGGISNDRTILNPKLGNFCDSHECPEGIVAVKTEKKKLTCSGIVKSQSEVLISENCATENEAFNIQTTDGKLIKVTSVEDELSNEFGDKILKLNLEKEIPNTANIELPEIDNNEVQLNYFNELGELQSQDCELTYASLAYANSFDNESQLLNIKNCEGVRDGALISQNGKSIGFLTKKHNEIELYEGISLNGEQRSINILSKIEELSYQIGTDAVYQIGYLAFSFPENDLPELKERITFNKDNFKFKKSLICFKRGNDIVFKDIETSIIFDNKIQELNVNTIDNTYPVKHYIPRTKVYFGHKLASQIPSKYNYITTTQNINSIEKHYFRNPFNNEIITERYKFSSEDHNLLEIDYCK